MADFQLFPGSGSSQILGKCSPRVGVRCQSASYRTGGDGLPGKQMTWPYVLPSEESVGLSELGRPWRRIRSGTREPPAREARPVLAPLPAAPRTLAPERFLQQLLIAVSFGSAACASGQRLFTPPARQAPAPRSEFRGRRRVGRTAGGQSRAAPRPAPGGGCRRLPRRAEAAPAASRARGEAAYRKGRGGAGGAARGGGRAGQGRAGEGRGGAGGGRRARRPLPRPGRAARGRAGARRCGRAGSAIGAEPRRSGGRAVNGARRLACHRLPPREGDTGILKVRRASRGRAMGRRGGGRGSCLPSG